MNTLDELEYRQMLEREGAVVARLNASLGRKAPPTELELVEAQRDELLAALKDYMVAVAQMNLSMSDGINVQGAMSFLVGAEDNALAAIAKCEKP